MTKKKLMTQTTALILLALPLGAAQLDVNTTAAMTGNFGLEVLFDGTEQSAFVVDTTPDNETVYRATFQITLTDLFDFETSLPQSTGELRQRAHHQLFNVKDLDQPPGLARQHVSIHLKKVNEGGTDRFRIWARAYSPTDPLAASDGFVYRDHLGGAMEVNLPTNLAGYPVTVLFEWRQASSPGASDGLFSLKRANAFAPGTFQGKAHTQLANGDKDVDQVELGAIGGVDDGTVGSYYLDDFQSFRTLSP